MAKGAFGGTLGGGVPPLTPPSVLLLGGRPRGEVVVTIISALPTVNEDRRVLTEFPSELDATPMDTPIIPSTIPPVARLVTVALLV